MTKQNQKKIIIYQAPNGAIEFRGDFNKETVWGSLQQIADLFKTDKSGISRHIRNIYQSNELKRNSTVAKIATVEIEGKRKVRREIKYFNLDVILSVGYRVNSKIATKFRQWAAKTLHEHIFRGYTINKKRLTKNYDDFLLAIETVKKLLPAGGQVKADDALELIKMFTGTWFTLDAYDKGDLPSTGANKKSVQVTVNELPDAFIELKNKLVDKKEASDFFGQEREREGGNARDY